MDNLIDASRVFRMNTTGNIEECMGKPNYSIGNCYMGSLLCDQFTGQYSDTYSDIVGIFDYWSDAPTPIELFQEGQVIGCLKEN